MHIRIRNIIDRPLSEGSTSGEHAYLKPGQSKEVPIEIGEKWCSLGYASIDIDSEDTECPTLSSQKPDSTRQLQAARKIMGKLNTKEEVGDA